MLSEDEKALYDAGINASEDLRLKLSKIRVKVSGKDSPNVISAVTSLFGAEYINSQGDTYITYDMYCSVINLIRTLGTTTAEEML